jgi:hypothetical protein
LPAKQRNHRTRQYGLEYTGELLHGGGRGFESHRLHSEMCGFAAKT